MISTLPEFTRKSFKNYSMKEKGIKFGYVTYIYGENGRGKSSLAEEIREYSNYNGKEVRVFNRDYASEVLTLDDSNSRLRGVKAILGQSNSKIMKEIHTVWIKRKDKCEREIPGLENYKKELEERIKKSVKDIVDSLSYPGATIRRKSSNSGISKMLQNYKEEYELLSNKFKEKLEVSKENLENIDSTKIDEYLMKLRKVNIDYERISIDWASISNRLTSSPDNSPESAIFLEWIKEGLKLHSSDKSGICQFCLNALNINDIYERMQKHQETLRLKEDLRRIKNDIMDYISKSNNCLSQIRLLNLNPEIPGYNEKIFNSINNSEIYNDLLFVLEAKIQDISLTQDFPETEQLKINHFNDLLYSYVKNINDECENKIQELEKLQQNISDFTKMLVDEEVLSSALIHRDYQEYKIVDRKLKNKKELYNFTKRKIDELNKSMSEYSDFKEFLNNSLNNANFPINLNVETDGGQTYYTLQNTQGNKLTIDSISEGEKNIISLLYFYHELLETRNKNKEPKIKDSISVVIVDDPIASLDAANKYWIMEIVKSLIEKCKNNNECQIFILTHSWEDYINLTYGKNDDINTEKKIKNGNIDVEKYNTTALLEVRKDKDGNSFISFLQNHNIDYPYTFIFRNIYNLSIQDDPVDSKCYMYHSPNDMRRIFETFLQHKTKDGLFAQSSNQKEIEALYKQSCKKDFQDKPGLGALLAYINIESHHVHRSVDIQKHAKVLMEYIKDVDPLHFKAITG